MRAVAERWSEEESEEESDESTSEVRWRSRVASAASQKPASHEPSPLPGPKLRRPDWEEERAEEAGPPGVNLYLDVKIIIESGSATLSTNPKEAPEETPPKSSRSLRGTKSR